MSRNRSQHRHCNEGCEKSLHCDSPHFWFSAIVDQIAFSARSAHDFFLSEIVFFAEVSVAILLDSSKRQPYTGYCASQPTFLSDMECVVRGMVDHRYGPRHLCATTLFFRGNAAIRILEHETIPSRDGDGADAGAFRFC
jgi:hypothetical protein